MRDKPEVDNITEDEYNRLLPLMEARKMREAEEKKRAREDWVAHTAEKYEGVLLQAARLNGGMTDRVLKECCAFIACAVRDMLDAAKPPAEERMQAGDVCKLKVFTPFGSPPNYIYYKCIG